MLHQLSFLYSLNSYTRKMSRPLIVMTCSVKEVVHMDPDLKEIIAVIRKNSNNIGRAFSEVLIFELLSCIELTEINAFFYRYQRLLMTITTTTKN